MTGYDFWLFDLDGTLVDVERSYARRVIAKTGSRLGYHFSEHQADQLWYSLGGPPETHLEQWGIDPERFWTAFHETEDPHERANHTFLYQDATVVEELSDTIGLVTHCQPYLAQPVLRQLGIEDWFDVIICCNDDLGWKPDPGPVTFAMDELGLPSDAAGVVVGDTADDIGAAWNAGLEGIHIERHDQHHRGCCVWADHRLASCEDLVTILHH